MAGRLSQPAGGSWVMRRQDHKIAIALAHPLDLLRGCTKSAPAPDAWNMALLKDVHVVGQVANQHEGRYSALTDEQ